MQCLCTRKKTRKEKVSENVYWHPSSSTSFASRNLPQRAPPLPSFPSTWSPNNSRAWILQGSPCLLWEMLLSGFWPNSRGHFHTLGSSAELKGDIPPMTKMSLETERWRERQREGDKRPNCTSLELLKKSHECAKPMIQFNPSRLACKTCLCSED